MDIYVVKSGDTLNAIAQRYGVSASLLADINGLDNPDRLVVGQALLIARPAVVHTVGRGETLYSIAILYQTTVDALYRNNPQLEGMPLIRPGQELTVSFGEEPGRELVVGGYAYPFVERRLLSGTLPYLSLLYVFAYGFDQAGNLISLNDDEELVLTSRGAGVKPFMVLAPLTAEGMFDNDLISAVLQSDRARTNLIRQILATMEAKGYQGLDLDFEYVKAEDKEAYIRFAQELAPLLHAEGYLLSIALAPKYYAEQPGLLYEGQDYYRLGQIADLLLLMTYEWGYSYGPPMAVAPIQEVRRVAEYGISEIPREKILLGIPNYGYDWTLPYVEGRRAVTIGNQEALDIAYQNNAAIEFDREAMAPYFHYFTPEGVEHVVWFEDVRSILAKLTLAEELRLRGVGYWTIMRPFTQNWMLINLLQTIKR